MKAPKARNVWLPAVTLASILIGTLVWRLSSTGAQRIWMMTLVVTGGVVVTRTARRALQGHLASDLIAALAILVAIALQHPLPGLIVVLMQTGGEALERFAEGRASKAVRALEADRPQLGHLVRDDVVTDVPASTIQIGDHLIVRPGELIPCDGVVTEGHTDLDTSRLTGEPLPVSVHPGTTVLSGSVNGNRPFTMRSTAPAAESQYARIVELVRTAQTTKAPFQRLADRYAIWFTPLTLLVAGAAAIGSGDLERALAVLVVATPCPLILAPPIAVVGGINRAARRHIIIRTGAAVEQLTGVDVAIFDKTGTLTIGKPTVSHVTPAPTFTSESLLRLAGSVEQGSGHLLARTLTDAATAAGVTLAPATGVVETAGQGVTGLVDGAQVTVGARRYVAEQLSAEHQHILATALPAGLTAYVAVNGAFAGSVTYADRPRDGVSAVLADLRALGVHRAILLSGDDTQNAQAIAQRIGITEVRGNLTPGDKATAVRDLIEHGHRVLMVGDGTNDAPALSTATVGVALAGHGGGVSAEAADVVMLTDDLGRLPEAIHISRRTMTIAKQSMRAGLILSSIAMVIAAAGYIAPTVGALLQEVIDVAVIMNALRASRTPRAHEHSLGFSDLPALSASSPR